MSSEGRFEAARRPAAMRVSVVSFVILAAVALLAGAGALRGWWLNDDPQVLLQAYLSTPFGVLFSPAVWKTLSSSNFTPLVTISFDADLAIAGLRPWFFYLHQLLAIFVAAFLLERLLRRFVRPVLSISAASIFLIAPQTVLAMRMLMVRHYVEGLVLSLGALILFHDALDEENSPRRRRILLVFAAFLYLVAMLAKEVYAPLPLLFIAIAEVRHIPLRRLAASMVPAAVAAVAYVGWRLALLGSAGGYGSSQERAFSLAPLLQSIFGERWRLTAGLTICAALFLLALVVRFRQSMIVGIASLLFLAIPVAPVLSAFQPRYGFVPAVTVIALAALAAEVALRRDLQWLFIALALPMIAAGQSIRAGQEAYARAMRAEGEYVWKGSGATLFARSPSWYLDGIADLRRLSKRGEAPPFVCSMYGLALEHPANAVMSIDGSTTLVPVDVPRLVEASAMRNRLEAALQMRIEASSRDDLFEWHFSPAEGKWVFLSYPAYDAIEIAPEGSRRVPEARKLQRFRVVREAGGRWNVTPPLAGSRDDGRAAWRNF